jgi:hypothetical protein
MSEQNRNEPQAVFPQQPQGLVLLCRNATVRDLHTFAEQVERQLTHLDVPATILKCGFSPKTGTGSIVIEAARSIPDAALAEWQEDQNVIDYLPYDVPSVAQEEQAAFDGDEHATDDEDEPEEALSFPDYQPELNPLSPPPLPEGYTPHSVPRTLLTSHDSYWLVWAWVDKIGEGLLLYDANGEARAFFVAEEGTTLLYTLLERTAGDLLPHCSPEYVMLHAPGVALIQAYLRAFQWEMIRRRAQQP